MTTKNHVPRKSRRRDARLLGQLVKAAVKRHRPVMGHLVVTRRCNLTCGYCYEADRSSAPVPLAMLKERVDHLARLRTVLVTLTGGEPLLHPDIVKLVAYVRACGMTPVMNSNGFLLTRERIVALGEAGLFAIQISVDNVVANETSKKALTPLMPKLRLLAEHARFRVRINTVLGPDHPEQAVTVARAALALGFDAKCSLVRDDSGAVVAASDRVRQAYQEIGAISQRAPSYLNEDFQETLLRDGHVDWKCRAGARYFTVCDKGLVHYCESSYGSPGTPLSKYTRADIERAFDTPKPCAATCAVAYAHQASQLDRFRSQPEPTPTFAKECWLQAMTVS